MMLKTLKCLKEVMREKRNVRMPPHTSAQYLECHSPASRLCNVLHQPIEVCFPRRKRRLHIVLAVMGEG